MHYHCSTIAQYQLLFEQRGYDTKVNGDSLELFKYGKHQGNVSLEGLEQKTKQPLTVNIPKIKALLYKYKRKYSSKLEKENACKYTTSKPCFQSDLTQFMKQRFGLEFIFFAAKQNENPYGYVIIDHNNKAVLKGSEVMKLQSLISEEYLSGKQRYEEKIIKELKIVDPDLNNPNFEKRVTVKEVYS